MTRIPASWQSRLLLIGLGVLSFAPFAPFALQRVLAQAHIFDIRWAGGLHPSDILELHWAGNLAIYVPVVIVVALILSFIRPALTHSLLITCVTLSLLSQLLFLYCAVIVIILNVAPPHI